LILRAESALETLLAARELRLLDETEVRHVMVAFEPSFPFFSSVRLADSMHVHVKVDAVIELPHEELLRAGGAVENEKDGYIKYAFASGMNLIFSSIPVSQDDLREKPDGRRQRPFLDHYGIDVRRETAEAIAAFDAIPARAAQLGFAHVAQGGAGNRVFCCHTSVGAKHWVFAKGDEGGRLPSIEIAYGALTVQPGKSGCDLRPSDPSLATPPVACCGAPPTTA
jgi:hypothetical protein